MKSGKPRSRWVHTFLLTAAAAALIAGCGSGGGALVETAREKGMVFVADYQNHRIVETSLDRSLWWRTFGAPGSGINQFDGPSGIYAASVRGPFYISDYGNHRIVRINDMTGAGWTAFGTFGSGTGQFNGPIGIFVR